MVILSLALYKGTPRKGIKTISPNFVLVILKPFIKEHPVRGLKLLNAHLFPQVIYFIKEHPVRGLKLT